MLPVQKSLISVNPARAGMILLDTEVPTRPTGKPRASGDDPTQDGNWEDDGE